MEAFNGRVRTWAVGRHFPSTKVSGLISVHFEAGKQFLGAEGAAQLREGAVHRWRPRGRAVVLHNEGNLRRSRHRGRGGLE